MVWTSWISKKGGILEKALGGGWGWGGVDLEKEGGMNPLTNYGRHCKFYGGSMAEI